VNQQPQNNFHSPTVHLHIINVFIFHQLMHKRIALKEVLKFTLKQHHNSSVQSPSSGRPLPELAKATVVKTVN